MPTASGDIVFQTKCGDLLKALVLVSVVSAGVSARSATMDVLAQASSGPLRCEIRKNEAEGSVELTGVIIASGALSGHFRFTVTRSGPSGSSNINQANTFDLVADREHQVGSVRINHDSASHAVVELVAGAGDAIECRARASL
jgi:hypothetical protein